MTAFTRKSFSVGAPGSQAYRDNWERTFRGESETPRVGDAEPPCPVHPMFTGGEVKTIGLGFMGDPLPYNVLYERWALKHGSKCSCGRKLE